jgi:hypothetical protein
VSDRDSNSFQQFLLAPSGRHFEKGVGCVSALIAAVLAAFDVFLLVPMSTGNFKNFGLFSLLVISLALTYFFASVGYRLIRNRPNLVGSVAAPALWFACFLIFAALSIAFVSSAVLKHDFNFAQGAALSGLLALLAFGAGSHFRGRR